MPASHPDSPIAPAWDMSITVGENTARIAGVTLERLDAPPPEVRAAVREGEFRAGLSTQ